MIFLELSDPFGEPVYEKILRSVKDIKISVTTIKEAAADGGENKYPIGVVSCQMPGQHNCVSTQRGRYHNN